MDILESYNEEILAHNLQGAAPEMFELLKTAVKYLSHEEVAKIDFAIPSQNVANAINKLIADIEPIFKARFFE